MDSASQNSAVPNQKTDRKEALLRKSKKKNKKRDKNRPDEFAVKSSQCVNQPVLCNENTKHVDCQITFNISNENCFSEDVTLTKKQKTDAEEEEDETLEAFMKFHQKSPLTKKKSVEKNPLPPPHVSSRDTNSSSIDAKLKKMDKPTPIPLPVVFSGPKTKKLRFPATPFGDKVPIRKPAFQNNTNKVTELQNTKNQQISKPEGTNPDLIPSVTKPFLVQSISDAENVPKPPTKGRGKIPDNLYVQNTNPGTSNGKGRSKNKPSNRPYSGDSVNHSVTHALVEDQRNESTSTNRPGSKDLITNARNNIKKEPPARLLDNVSVNTKNQNNDYQRNEQPNFDKKENSSKTSHHQFQEDEVNNESGDTSNNQMTKESKSHQENQHELFSNNGQFSQEVARNLSRNCMEYSRNRGRSRGGLIANVRKIIEKEPGAGCWDNVSVNTKNQKPSSTLEDRSHNRARPRGKMIKTNNCPRNTEQSYVSNSEPCTAIVEPPPGFGFKQSLPPYRTTPGPPPGFEHVIPTKPPVFNPNVPPPIQGQNFDEPVTPHTDENREKSVNRDHSHSSKTRDYTPPKRQDDNRSNSGKFHSKGDGDRPRQNYRENKKKYDQHPSQRDSRRTNYGTRSKHHYNQDGDHTYKHDSKNTDKYDENRTHGNYSPERSSHYKRDNYNKSYNHENYTKNQPSINYRNKHEKYPKNTQTKDDNYQTSRKESQQECKSYNQYPNHKDQRSTNRSFKSRLPSCTKNEDDRHQNASKCTCPPSQPQNVIENWADQVEFDFQEEISLQPCDYCKTKSNDSCYESDENRSSSRNKKQNTSKEDRRSRENEREKKHRSRSRSKRSHSERDRSRSSNLSKKSEKSLNDFTPKPSTRNRKNKADFENYHHQFDDTKNRTKNQSKKNRNELFVPNAKLYEPVIREIRGDLFQVSELYSLAHCVAADLRMGAGIAVKFRKMFRGMDDLMYQDKKVGEVAVLRRDNRCIFYLITKQYSDGKPTLQSLTEAIRSLKKSCEEYNVTKLAIPRIGCGLDRLDWNQVKEILFAIFRNTGIEILVCVN